MTEYIRSRALSQSTEAPSRSNCFSSNLFGCGGICSIDDNDIVTRSRPCFRVGRAQDACHDHAIDSRDVLESDDSEFDGSGDEDEAPRLEVNRPRFSAGCLPQLPIGDGCSASSKRGHGQPALSTQSSASTSASSFAALEKDVEALMNKHHQLFQTHGWEVTKMGHGFSEYLINGERLVRLLQALPGAPLPDTRHLNQMLGPEVAEQARRILVVDGPLQQPLLDYLAQTGRNEQYDKRGTENPESLTPAARMLEFNILETGDRIDAMRHAKMQADLRRRAATDDRKTGRAQQVRSASLGKEDARSARSVTPPPVTSKESMRENTTSSKTSLLATPTSSKTSLLAMRAASPPAGRVINIPQSKQPPMLSVPVRQPVRSTSTVTIVTPRVLNHAVSGVAI